LTAPHRPGTPDIDPGGGMNTLHTPADGENMGKQSIDGSLTVERLREALRYDPMTGLFTWPQRRRTGLLNSHSEFPAGHRKTGKDGGYIVIRINFQLYRAHRLAWFYVHGEWPNGEIDHINGDPTDNRIANLRVATSSNQRMNSRRRTDNTSGVKGVCYDRRREKWIAEIMIDGKKHHLGQFPTLLEAKGVRLAAAERLHGSFARHD